MSPARIRVRENRDGSKSYQVVYRRGGRGYAVTAAGTFRTTKEAKIRRDLVGGWLAQGLDPRAELDRMLAAPARARVYSDVAAEYQASRIDHADQTAISNRSHLKRLLPIFGDRDPLALTVADNIAAVAVLAADLKPSSLARYWATHRLILDFAGCDPNPARDPKVKLPQVEHLEPVPPTDKHVLAMLDRTPFQRRLPLVLLEQTGMAVGEASSLAWGDVDETGNRLRLRRSEVKAAIRARARWVQVPEWLMRLISETCPPDDRTADRRVFPGFTPDVAKNVMARACVAARIPHFHPHDLRHRRTSLWHGQGVSAKELSARIGHSNASMTLDVYSHVMPLEEIPADRFEALLVRTR